MNNQTTKRFGLRWLCWLLGGVLLLAVTLHMTASALGTYLINQKLPGLLNTEVSLGAFQLNLIQGRAGFSDLVIYQPEAKEPTPLLSLKGLHAEIPVLLALRANPIVIETVDVERLEVYVRKQSDGSYNFSPIMEKISESDSSAQQEEAATSLPALWLKKLHAAELKLVYLDQQNNLNLIVQHFNVNLSHLRITTTADRFPQITLDAIDMDHLNLSLEVNEKSAPVPSTETTPTVTQKSAPASDQTSVPTDTLQGVWIKSLHATQFTFHLLDHQSGLETRLEEFDLKLDNLLAGDVEGAPPYADLSLSSKLLGIEASSRLQINGRIGPILPGRAPAVQMATSLIGFELDSVKPIINTSAAKTLGEGLDLYVFLEILDGKTLPEQALGGEWRLITSRKIEFDNSIEGTIGEPVLGLADLTHQLFIGGTFRMTENVAGNIVSGSGDAVEAVGDTSMEALEGVGKTTQGFLGGVWGFLKGTATLDTDEMSEGLEDATIGTIADAGNTVTDTAGAAGEGVVGTAQSTGGIGKGDIWLDEIETRAKVAREEGLTWLDQKPFPGM